MQRWVIMVRQNRGPYRRVPESKIYPNRDEAHADMVKLVRKAASEV